LLTFTAHRCHGRRGRGRLRLRVFLHRGRRR
jgi:hypothetical protein